MKPSISVFQRRIHEIEHFKPIISNGKKKKGKRNKEQGTRNKEQTIIHFVFKSHEIERENYNNRKDARSYYQTPIYKK